MKNLLLLILLLQSVFTFSQAEPEFQKYNAKNAANIFYYDFSEIPEKIKLKDEETEHKISVAIRKYNNKIKDISFLNSTKLQDLELTINSLEKQLYSNRDLAEKISKRIQKTVLPVRDSIDVYEKNLNGDLKSFLSKRQFKKWLKYQKSEKRKLLPERPKSQNRAPTNMNSTRDGRLENRRY